MQRSIERRRGDYEEKAEEERLGGSEVPRGRSIGPWIRASSSSVLSQVLNYFTN